MKKKVRDLAHARNTRKALVLHSETLRQLDTPEVQQAAAGVHSDTCSFKPGTFECCEYT